MIHFLFPRDPRNRNAPEDFFAEQAGALAAAGFTFSLFGGEVLRRGEPLQDIPASAIVVYRGWMLNAGEYGRLVTAITEAGATALTPLDEYLAAHHLPNWYPLITDLTPETRVYPAETDLVAELDALAWDGYFVKDYVKSLKTSIGSHIRHASQIAHVVAEMKEYRGEIEGGICVRRVEDLVADTERRLFVIRGRVYDASGTGGVPDEARKCAERVPSAFFSVDVARRSDGVLRVVEIGDGQVSDIVGWSAAAFARMWQQASRHGIDGN